MPTKKSKTILIVTALCLTSVYLIYARVLCKLEEYCVVKTIDAGPDRTIMIMRRFFSNFGRPLYYQVAAGDRVVVPMTFIWGCCGRDWSPRFKVLYSKDRNLVGLVSEKRPTVLLMLHDFRTGENWPRAKNSEPGEKSLERGVLLRDRLKSDHPELALELSHLVP